jgi:hypothetical protein
MPKYIKFLLPSIFITGLLIYYLSGNPIHSLFRSLPYLLLGFWYSQSFWGKFRFSSIFVFIHLTIATTIPIKILITGKKLSLDEELLINLVGNLCLLIVFAENIFLKKYNLEKGTFMKISLPYIALPIVFLSLAILPNLNQFYSIAIIIFSIILIATGILSIYYSNKEIVKLYVSWGMFLLIMAHGMNAINLLSYHFVAAHGVVYSLTLIAKVLIVYGLIKEHELGLDKENR